LEYEEALNHESFQSVIDEVEFCASPAWIETQSEDTFSTVDTGQIDKQVANLQEGHGGHSVTLISLLRAESW
jgi:hypothetical protein